jgi:hypothetical protein
VALRVRKVTDGRDWVEFAVADTGIGLTASLMTPGTAQKTEGPLEWVLP